MNACRKLLLLSAREDSEALGAGLDLQRLCAALRRRGAEVETQVVSAATASLLDRLEAGVMPVVFRDGMHG